MFSRVLIFRMFSVLLVVLIMSGIASSVLASQTVQDHTVTSTTLGDADYWSMYGHDSAHTSRSSANGPNTADLAWIYPDEIVGDVVVGPDGTIYGSSYNPSILRAIKPDGTLKWEWPAGFAETINHLAVVDNAVYAVVSVTGSTFYAFDPTDGSVLWTYPMNRVSYSNPTIGSDGTIYIASQLGDYHSESGWEGGYLYAIRPDGTLKWRWDSGIANCGIETSAAIGPNGDIYIQHNCRGLVALNSNGQFKWERGGGQLGQPWNSPSVGPDGTIYIGSSDYTFRALNPDGSEKWQVAVDGWMYSSSSAISADGSTIYRGDNSGGFYAFDSQGSVKWKFESGWGIFEPPTLSANGIVYFTQSLDSSAEPDDKAYLYALRATDGALLWKYELGQDGGTPVIGPDGTLYVTREQPSENWYINQLYAFQCADGTCAIAPGNQTLTVNKSGTGSGTVTSSPAGINCGSDCSESFVYNTVVTLTATPTSPSTFGGWSGSGCSGTGTCTVTMNAAQSVTATFNSPGNQTLTVNKAGTGSGIVTSSPAGINCGSTCSYAFAYNTVVTLTATPIAPSTFGGWSGACTGTGVCIVTMNAAQSVTAAFNSPDTGGDTTGVFRPSNGLLYLKNQNTTGFADVAINYGTGGDYPIAGDWDGNGTATIGIYRNGSFYLRNSNTLGFADIVFAFGTPGDQPVAGDWDGDGVDTIGVYSNGQFLLRNNNSAGTADMSFYLGNPGDVGIAGDWDGDGSDTTGVFRPSNGIIFLKNANTTGFADVALNYGLAGDMPLTGDWNNDGIDTIGVYRNAQFLLRNSNTIGFAEIVFGLGNPGDMPISGNWDGLP